MRTALLSLTTSALLLIFSLSPASATVSPLHAIRTAYAADGTGYTVRVIRMRQSGDSIQADIGIGESGLAIFLRKDSHGDWRVTGGSGGGVPSPEQMTKAGLTTSDIHAFNSGTARVLITPNQGIQLHEYTQRSSQRTLPFSNRVASSRLRTDCQSYIRQRHLANTIILATGASGVYGVCMISNDGQISELIGALSHARTYHVVGKALGILGATDLTRRYHIPAANANALVANLMN